jgi:hypothetical protein
MTMEQHDGGVVMPSAGAGAAAVLNGGGIMTATARAAMAREMAEVMAQVQVAKACPRRVEDAITRVERSCKRYRFADQAFYSYKRGGKTVTGPTVHLIRELGAAWQNFESGLIEIDRGRDEYGPYSMMQAFAWDKETNARRTFTFMVRAVRDLAPDDDHPERRKVPLFDERDIYENNASMGARREREMAKSLLPAWYVAMGEDLCYETLERGPLDQEGKAQPLEVRLHKAINGYLEEFDVRQDRLEAFIGAPAEKWKPRDLVKLTVTYRSLSRGEVTVDEVFGAPRATAADAAAQAGAPAEPAGTEPAGTEPAADMTAETRAEIDRLFGELGVSTRPPHLRRLIARALAGTEARRWADFNQAHGEAIAEGLRQVLTTVAEQDRPARLAELEAAGRESAATPADGGRPATENTRNLLRARFGRGGLAGDEHADLRDVVTAVLVHGHYAEMGELGEAQARYALERFDQVAADAATHDEPLAARLNRMYEAAIRERAAADRDDDEAAGEAGGEAGDAGEQGSED